ncbi:MAG: response regulator [Polyangiales bacterium]
MQSLVVEDEFTTRMILQRFLSDFGTCDVATTGREAVLAFESALTQNSPYDLVCLDIQLPELDGQDVLKKMRSLEHAQATSPGEGVKVIMVTGVRDPKSIVGAFRSGCESYLVKPIERDTLLAELQKLGLQ